MNEAELIKRPDYVPNNRDLRGRKAELCESPLFDSLNWVSGLAERPQNKVCSGQFQGDVVSAHQNTIAGAQRTNPGGRLNVNVLSVVDL
jgi:hypothetical protein